LDDDGGVDAMDVPGFIPAGEGFGGGDGEVGGFDDGGFDGMVTDGPHPIPGLNQNSDGAQGAMGGEAFGGNRPFVQAPKKLQVEMISYARVDKRVDVKALKRSIWQELCSPPNVQVRFYCLLGVVETT